MSTYRNEYCPFCKKALTIHERSEFYDYTRYIGLKYERCPYCQKIFSTNRKLYSEMNQQEKSNISSCYFFNIISLSFTIYAVIILILIFICSSIFDVNIGDIVGYIFISPVLPAIVLGYLLSKKNYNILKNLTIDDFKNIDEELKEINLKDKKEDESLKNLLNKLK